MEKFPLFFLKEGSCEDLLKFLFNLNDLDIKILELLKDTEEISVVDLAKKLSKDRSTIYRSLQKLVSCGLCSKTTRCLESGGYYHSYKILPKDELKKQLKKVARDVYETMIAIIESF